MWVYVFWRDPLFNPYSFFLRVRYNFAKNVQIVRVERIKGVGLGSNNAYIWADVLEGDNTGDKVTMRVTRWQVLWHCQALLPESEVKPKLSAIVPQRGYLEAIYGSASQFLLWKEENYVKLFLLLSPSIHVWSWCLSFSPQFFSCKKQGCWGSQFLVWDQSSYFQVHRSPI